MTTDSKADNFRSGDKFKYKTSDGTRYGVVISYDRDLLITGSRRRGYILTRDTVPENAQHLPSTSKKPVPWEINIALCAASMVLDC